MLAVRVPAPRLVARRELDERGRPRAERASGAPRLAAPPVERPCADADGQREGCGGESAAIPAVEDAEAVGGDHAVSVRSACREASGSGVQQARALTFARSSPIAGKLTRTASRVPVSRPRQKPFRVAQRSEEGYSRGVQPVGLSRGRPVCLQADAGETPCCRAVAGVGRSHLFGESPTGNHGRRSERRRNGRNPALISRAL